MARAHSPRRWTTRVAVALGVVFGALAAASLAWALFSDASPTETNSFSAGSIGAGQQPTATVLGRDVSLSWGAASNAASYNVARSNVSPQSLSTTEHGSCATSVSATSCTDTGVPENGTLATNWTYADTPQLHNWLGATSPASATVVVPAPSLSLVTSTFTTAGGSTNATVSNFFDNEGVTYCLDQNTTPCTTELGTGLVALSGGTATDALTIPAGLSVGTHTVYAVGSQGSVPSASITINPGAATKLVYTTSPPSSTTAGATFSVAVAEEDSYNNVETGDSTTAVSLAANNGGGGFSCTTTPTHLTGGTASFSGCSYTVASATAYTLTATAGSLTAQANTTVSAGTAHSIAVYSGSPQTTSTSAPYASPLVAIVTDTYGNPVSGVSVTFAGPSTGASGTFATCSGGNPNGYSCKVTTNANGEATSSTFTANATAGSYNVTATATGVGTPASFSLTQAAPTVTAISPSYMAYNSSGVDATVTGTNFVSVPTGLTVTFTGGSSGSAPTASVVSVTPTTIAITISQSGGSSSATWNVVVTNPGGATGICTQCFVVTGDTDSISSVSPGAVGQGASNVLLTINMGTLINGCSGGPFTVQFSNPGITVHSGGLVTCTGPTTLTIPIDVAASAPTGVGSVTVFASAQNYTASANDLTVDPSPLLTFTPTTLPGATAGTAYSQSITASGGDGSYTYTETGTLPTGVTFSGGTLSGTPTQAGSFPIQISATDTASHAGSQSYTLVVTAGATGLSPTSGTVGTTGVTILAQGFIASHALTVTVGGTSATITSGGTTNSNGTSTVAFTIPAVPAGPETVVVSDGTNSATSATNFTVTPQITSLSSTTGTVGTTVTVTGNGFKASASSLSVVFGGTSYSMSGTTNANGVLTTASFTVPTVPDGSYTVAVKDGTNTSANFGTNYTVTPQILTLSSTSGTVGTTVNVTGNGFAASASSLTLVFGGTDYSMSGTTNPSGVLTSASFTVPTVAAGSYPVAVSDGTNTSPNYATNYTVNAALSVSPTSGTVGSTATLSGTGYTSGKTVATSNVTFGSSGTVTITTQTVATNGTWSATFTVPNSSGGAQAITATDSGSDSASTTFTVNAALSVSPTSGTVGSTAILSGTGYTSGKTVATSSVTFGSSGTVTITTQTVATNGTWSASFTVPASSNGAQTITVTDSGSDSASTTFTVSAPGTFVVPAGYANVTFTICGGGGGGGAGGTHTGGTGGAGECQSGTINVPPSGTTLTEIVGGGGAGGTAGGGGTAGTSGYSPGGTATSASTTDTGGGGGGASAIEGPGSTVIVAAGGGAGGAGAGVGPTGGGTAGSGGNAGNGANSGGSGGGVGGGGSGTGYGTLGSAGSGATTSSGGGGGGGGGSTGSGGNGNTGVTGTASTGGSGGYGGSNGGGGGGGGGGGYYGGGGGGGGGGGTTNNGAGGGGGGGGSTFDYSTAGTYLVSGLSSNVTTSTGGTAGATGGGSGGNGTNGSVSITLGQAVKLVFTTQPSTPTNGGTAFSTQPVVKVENASTSSVITWDSSTVTLALGTPTSGGPGTLSGCSQSETSGVVSFTGCEVNTAGIGYTLTATDTTDGLTTPSTPSSAFTITEGVSQSDTANGSTSADVTLSSEPSSGSTMVLLVYSDGSTSTPSFSGAGISGSPTLITSASPGTNYEVWAYDATATGTSEVVDVSVSGASHIEFDVAVLYGDNTSSPIANSDTKTGTSNSPEPTAILPSTPATGDYEFAFLGTGGNSGTITTPSNWTKIESTSSTSPAYGVGSFYATSTYASTSTTITIADSVPWATIALDIAQ